MAYRLKNYLNLNSGQRSKKLGYFCQTLHAIVENILTWDIFCIVSIDTSYWFKVLGHVSSRSYQDFTIVGINNNDLTWDTISNKNIYKTNINYTDRVWSMHLKNSVNSFGYQWRAGGGVKWPTSLCWHARKCDKYFSIATVKWDHGREGAFMNELLALLFMYMCTVARRNTQRDQLC